MTNGRSIKSVFGIVVADSEVLFLKRSDTTSRPGQWGLPGGGVKKGECPERACIREVEEEAGLVVSVARSVGTFSHTRYFLCGPGDAGREVRLAKSESSDYAWVAPKECMKIGPIMDLGRLLPLFESLGMAVPALPEGLSPKYPD